MREASNQILTDWVHEIGFFGRYPESAEKWGFMILVSTRFLIIICIYFCQSGARIAFFH